MRRMLLAASLCGCGRIAFDAIPDGGDAPIGNITSDVRPDAVPCTMPTIFDAFAPGGPICGTWGGSVSMANSFRSNGLHIIPPAGTNLLANCTADPYSGNEGAFVSISQVTTLGT